MTHKDLLDIGFVKDGVYNYDPLYRITFKAPYKFGIDYLNGVLLNDGKFLLHRNDTLYTDKEELKKVMDIVGGEVYITNP